jgi:hypothetical protein
VQVAAVPVHAPPQPENVEPVVGVAVSVTEVPQSKVAMQVAPQLIPVGLLPTRPLPVPVLPIETVCGEPPGGGGGGGGGGEMPLSS